ncbi:tetratricopeptide repeat protein [Streptomyces sp. VNUA116]|uniref:tetratricopeptide repeat protein n=1 Tax=Streptomyces sp. VNUA116 TaxID=3062449 RepID=UPI0026772E1A|nr:tetratricopeptide repeat protein [Streptomyces sp. VNUA116]WKU48135.1 tetratricopeptide repeat protein [Streptomyces sp. VNUA116]
MDSRHDQGAALRRLQEKLEEARVAARLNKSLLAGLAGLGRTTVSQAFNSEVKVPTAHTLRALSPVLRLELRPLLELRDAAVGATVPRLRPGRHRSSSGVAVQLSVDNPAATDALPEPQEPSPSALPRWPWVADTNPLDAGLAVTGAGDVPAYVMRDLDGAVRERIRVAGRSGGTLLIVGDSAAGKTRTLYEAMRATLPGHRFVRPAQPADVPTLITGIVASADPCVLWLDELDRYLEGGCGLTAHGLAELRRSQAVLLATLDASALEGRGGTEVVRQMQHVELDRRWNTAERRRAAESRDPRVARAAARSTTGLGVAEYLAADPWLWTELRLADRAGGRPRGVALTRAGIDLSRAGIGGPLPTSLLFEAHRPYLVDSGGSLLRPEPVDDALAWAGRTRYGVTSMLLPVGEDVWRAHPQLVAAADEAGIPVHRLTWFQAFGAADSLDEILTVALNATRHEPSIGVCLWQALADAGIKEAANNLGVVLAHLSRHEEAERVYRTQADLEDGVVLLNLGNLLCRTGRHDEAAKAYHESGERGEANAWNNLGLLFKEQGEFARAEVCLRSAALANAPDAEYNLGVLLEERGRTEEAKASYARAYDAGDSTGLTNWGMLLLDEGRQEEAEPLLRQAADAGDRDAMLSLANAAKADGDMRQATDWYHRAIDAGDARAYFNLANLLRDHGQPGLAEMLYRPAIDAGITSAVYNLALLLMRQERFTEAETFLHQAVAHGHRKAMFHLGYALRQAGRPQAAAAQWELAAEEGDTDAAIALATVLTSPADQARLHRVLRRAADAGEGDAALVLSAMASPETGYGLGTPWHR